MSYPTPSPGPLCNFVSSLRLLEHRNISTGGDKWLMDSNRRVTVRKREYGRIRTYERSVDNPENDKLLLLYGERSEAHYELNELARLGLNRVLGKDTSDAFRLERSVSVFCNDVTHERNPDLPSHVTLNFELVNFPRSTYDVPVWEFHNCNECPPLCRCGSLNRMAERVITCKDCLKVMPMNHGQGFLNCYRVAAPHVVRLQTDIGTVAPTGSSVDRYQELAATYRHQVVLEHERSSKLSTALVLTGFRTATGYTGELEPLNRPSDVCSDLCVEVAGARGAEKRRLGGYRLLETDDTIESLTTEFQNAGVLEATSGWGTGGGSPWGAGTGNRPLGVDDNSLLSRLPVGASSRVDNPRFAAAGLDLRDTLAKLQTKKHCMSGTVRLSTTPVRTLEDVQRLNKVLEHYGCQISVPGFQLELVPKLANRHVRVADPHEFVQMYSYRNGFDVREASTLLAQVRDELDPPPRLRTDDRGHAEYHAQFRARFEVRLIDHLQTQQVTTFELILSKVDLTQSKLIV